MRYGIGYIDQREKTDPDRRMTAGEKVSRAFLARVYIDVLGQRDLMLIQRGPFVASNGNLPSAPSENCGLDEQRFSRYDNTMSV